MIKPSDRLSRIFSNTNKIKGDLNNMFNQYLQNNKQQYKVGWYSDTTWSQNGKETLRSVFRHHDQWLSTLKT